jgi:hypothetical protein
MTFPCIDIQRHDIGLYEWRIMYGNEKVDGDIGDSSITECLINAVGCLSDQVHILEVNYRGIHMGTFSNVELVKFTEAVAGRIVESYAALAQHLG